MMYTTSSVPCVYRDWFILGFPKLNPIDKRAAFKILSSQGHPNSKEMADLVRNICQAAGLKWEIEGVDKRGRNLNSCVFGCFRNIFQEIMASSDPYSCLAVV